MVTRTEATIEDLYNAPDDGKYELVDGRLVYMSPTGFRPVRIAGRIFNALYDYEEATGSGMAIGDNLGFIVRQPRLRSFSPDAAYIAEVLEETDDFVEGAPIFAVEVRSKGDYGPAHDAEYAAKRADYFAAGTQVVWDVSPRADRRQLSRRCPGCAAFVSGGRDRGCGTGAAQLANSRARHLPHGAMSDEQ